MAQLIKRISVLVQFTKETIIMDLLIKGSLMLAELIKETLILVQYLALSTLVQPTHNLIILHHYHLATL